MTNFIVGEGNGTVRQELETNPDIKVGDTIEYISNNQQGYEKYKVILEDGEKSLKLIDSFDHQMGLYDYDSDDEHDDSKPNLKGGKRKTHKRKTHKRKTHKRKNHKRKTHKKRYNRKHK
jgi:hypothetical protein